MGAIIIITIAEIHPAMEAIVIDLTMYDTFRKVIKKHPWTPWSPAGSCDSGKKIPETEFPENHPPS
jgi:hypothetical protein